MNLNALIKNKALNWTDLLDTPISITANEFVRGNGAGTDLVQFDLFGTSNVWTANQTFDNASLLMGDNPIENVGYIDFNLLNGIPHAEGRISWNDDDGTLNLGLKGGVVNLQIGQEQVVRGKNTSGDTILNGTPVRVSGASGNTPDFGLSDANDLAAAEAIGLATEDISNNGMGYVTVFGLVRDIDTTGTPVSETWLAADRIYVSDTLGELTNVMPSSTSRIIFIGTILRVHATEGIICVNPNNVSYISELSGVNISAIADDDFLKYNSGTSLWENFDLFGESNVWTEENTFNADVHITGVLYSEEQILSGGVTRVDLPISLDLLNNTISQWKMNDTSGTTVVDSIGSNNGISNTDTSTMTVAGKVNTALQFTSSTSTYVTIGTSLDMNFTSQDFSVSFWLKPSGAQANFAQYIHRGEFQVDGWYVGSGIPTQIVLGTNQSGVNQETKSVAGSVTVDVWNHVVVTRSGSDVKIYVNATEVSYSPKGTHINPTGNVSRVAHIGRNFSNSLRANAAIDVIGVYDKELSQTDIDGLYLMGNGTEELEFGTGSEINAIGLSSILESSYLTMGNSADLLVERDLEVQRDVYIDGDLGMGIAPLANIHLKDNNAIAFGDAADVLIDFDSVLGVGMFDGGNWLMNSTNQLQFRDSAMHVSSVDDGHLDLTADISIDLNSPIIDFGTNKAQFRDSAIGIYSQADTFLDLFADGAVRIGDSSIGVPTNYVNFAPDGQITLVGTARVEKHIESIGISGTGASSPTVRFTEEPYLSWTFAVNDDTHQSFEIPDSVDVSADVIIKVHWYTSIDQTDDEVQWEAEWKAVTENGGEPINGGGTLISSGDVTCPTQWHIKETIIGTISGGSLTAGDIIGLHLQRVAIDDGSNPLINTIHVLTIEFQYISNNFGGPT